MVNIYKPLVRWTKDSIGGSPCHIFSRYEKLANFCFYCGRMDHLDCDCKEMTLDGKKHYGLWLRANGQYSIGIKEIIIDLERLNQAAKPNLCIQSPKSLIAKAQI